MGFERPLRKHAGGMFLDRGRSLAPADASGCGCQSPCGDAIKTAWPKPRCFVLCQENLLVLLVLVLVLVLVLRAPARNC